MQVVNTGTASSELMPSYMIVLGIILLDVTAITMESVAFSKTTTREWPVPVWT